MLITLWWLLIAPVQMLGWEWSHQQQRLYFPAAFSAREAAAFSWKDTTLVTVLVKFLCPGITAAITKDKADFKQHPWEGWTHRFITSPCPGWWACITQRCLTGTHHSTAVRASLAQDAQTQRPPLHRACCSCPALLPLTSARAARSAATGTGQRHKHTQGCGHSEHQIQFSPEEFNHLLLSLLPRELPYSLNMVRPVGCMENM